MSVSDRAENLGQLLVDRFAVVVERRCLQNDGCRANEDGQGKYPEKETIQHHGHVLPVLPYLKESAPINTHKRHAQRK